MLIVSSIQTFASLAGLGVVVGLVYALLVIRGRRKPTGEPTPVRRPSAPPPQSTPLFVQEIVEQLVRSGDEETTFLNRASNTFITLGDELLAMLESDEPVEDLIDDSTPFSEAQLEGIRKGLRSKVLLQLPTKVETKEFQLRERFCSDLPDGEAKEQMLKVLRGQTGFRSFDGALQRLGIEESWRQFRDAQLATVAIGWMEKHGVVYLRKAA